MLRSDAVSSMGEASRPPTIFVSVASYRDSQCQYTLKDLFAKAIHPDRLVVGVCHQVAPEDSECFLLDLDAWSHQIRTLFLPHAESKGPCYARALIQQELLRDEDYYFQIDSHIRFAEGWDQILLQQLAACPSERPVLTFLGSGYELPRHQKAGEPDGAVLSRREAVTILSADKFGDECPGQDDAFLRIKSRVCRLGHDDVPPPALFWTARFHFSRSQAVRDCPYDPYLDYVFFGEEISMAARLYTSGWDLFNPTKVVGYHLQTRFHRPFYTEVQVSDLSVRRHRYAKSRLYRLLGDDRFAEADGACAPGPPYGLGTVRSLEAYEEFCGVSFCDHVVGDRARRGGFEPELLVPAWAEEARDELLSSKCFTDPEVWAGKGNAEALARQFPETLVVRGPDPALVASRDHARLRVADVRPRAGDPEGLLDLSRACAHLGQLEERLEDPQAAAIYEEALTHAEAAAALAPGDWTRSSLWRGSLALARAAACFGCVGRGGEAKALAAEALAAATEAILADDGDAPEALALDVVTLVHQVHERTDDRIGLRDFVRPLKALLRGLVARRRHSGPAAATALVAAGSSGDEETLRARLLEAALLVLTVPGTDDGDQAARMVFTDFPEDFVRSARLQRQLGLIQAGGMFLDLRV